MASAATPAPLPPPPSPPAPGPLTSPCSQPQAAVTSTPSLDSHLSEPSSTPLSAPVPSPEPQATVTSTASLDSHLSSVAAGPALSSVSTKPSSASLPVSVSEIVFINCSDSSSYKFWHCFNYSFLTMYHIPRGPALGNQEASAS